MKDRQAFSQIEKYVSFLSCQTDIEIYSHAEIYTFLSCRKSTNFFFEQNTPNKMNKSCWMCSYAFKMHKPQKIFFWFTIVLRTTDILEFFMPPLTSTEFI